MDSNTASSLLQRARRGIRQALVEWDPTDFLQLEKARTLLAVAVGEMRTFENAVRMGEVTASEELYDGILAVKQEIAQATRVVDACVAFHRGLATQAGDGPPGYDAEGNLQFRDPGLEPELLA